MSWELQLERRLERSCGLIECLASDVAVGPHHRRRDVSHLRLDDLQARFVVGGPQRAVTLTGTFNANTNRWPSPLTFLN